MQAPKTSTPLPKRYRPHLTNEAGTLAAEPREAPPAPEGVSRRVAEWWELVWSTPLAAAWEASDIPLLERLANLLDERWRAAQHAKEEGLIDRSFQADRLILQLEDRLGLSPMARLKLGITFADAQKALDTLNKEILEGWDE